MGFLADLTLGRYYPTGSVVHRLDPRVKMVGALAVLVSILLTESPAAYGFLTVVIAALVATSRLSPGFLWRNLASLRWLLVIVFLMHGILTRGEPVFAAIPWITREGLMIGGVFAWRVALMVSVATLLTATTSPVDLGDGIERLLRPLEPIGVPVHELAMVSVIALRFVPTLLDEARRIIKAQMGRGASFGGGPIARARSAVPILVPLFASAFRRADDLALAMDARCYRGAVGRTRYVELALTRRDVAALVITGMAIACTIAISSLS
ncbi:MAG: energy-coupling factor transporter transmembrane protein EcfT [Candidatus Eisenbacteria bacterium]|nr:energy-coupling factor transporter transmembrane protein EcfT [Candidatus Eisenbacteria bacterium]